MSMSRKFIVKLEEDDSGNLLCPIPDEIIEELGLVEGDLLNYSLDGESILLTPVSRD
jgi:antitoxin component of MazEF toxin-antitoxin module